MANDATENMRKKDNRVKELEMEIKLLKKAHSSTQFRLSLLLEPSPPNDSNGFQSQSFRIKIEPLDAPETEITVPEAVREEIIGEESKEKENKPPPITTMKDTIDCSMESIPSVWTGKLGKQMAKDEVHPNETGVA
ncbi:hypothetical protein GCK72_022748 [Caenorhabditis remanei]|uniref:Uncharacterized protein n=1 Tax=Caenorhabditis remanei TaxID=31234 RepID=A0A6A5FUW9_CAERE|nr:hypothetical protein GCK72_022748 [Caenorhabditis remanei]KAF1746295.1 hypothetical protein GCK72_022748 [Caenorhabditis remanei]